MAPSASQNAVTLSGALMVAAVVIIFFLFVFFLILYVRSNLFLAAPDQYPTTLHSSPFRRALHPTILTSLPLTVFSSADFKDGAPLECAVCISDLSDGDLFRSLPGCGHAFHLDCIDLWFASNSTCPVCRSSVELPKQSCSVYGGSLPAGACSGESSVFLLPGSGVRAAEEVKAPALASARSVRGGWDVERGLPPAAVAAVGGVGEVEGEESSSS